MKPRIWTSILLFISAYSPLFLIFAVRDFDFEETMAFRHPYTILVVVVVTMLSLIALCLVMKNLPTSGTTVEVTGVRDRSVDIINYTIPYMISFFGVDLSKPADVIAVIIFLVIMLLLTITSKMVFLNPILALAGYQLFDAEYRYNGRNHSAVVISKIELSRGKQYRILGLTRFLYFVSEEGDSHTHAE